MVFTLNVKKVLKSGPCNHDPKYCTTMCGNFGLPSDTRNIHGTCKVTPKGMSCVCDYVTIKRSCNKIILIQFTTLKMELILCFYYLLDFLTALRTDKILYVFLNSKKIMYNIVLHYLKNIK
ncbi:unnamed protein product [Brassica rapa subsp. narinosa]